MMIFTHPVQIPLFFLQLFFAMVEMALFVGLYCRIYGAPRKPAWQVLLIALVMIAVVTCGLRLVRLPHRSVAAATITVLCSLPLLLFFDRASRRKRAVFSLLLYTLALTWVQVSNYLTTPNYAWNDWLLEIVAHVGFWPVLLVIYWAGAAERDAVPLSMSLLLSAISAVSFGLMALIQWQMLQREDPFSGTLEVPVMATLLFINLSLFLFFGKFASLMRQAQERELLEQQLRLQEQHYREMERAQERIRTLHHDMRNTLSAAMQLIAHKGDHEETVQNLMEVSEQMRQYEQVIHTGNTALDSVLNLKLTELRADGIDVETDLRVPPELSIPFQKAVTIFGNLLDNVRDACMQLPLPKRRARLTIQCIHSNLLIDVQNPLASEPVAWKDGLPVTTKPDSRFHGLGLRSVRQSVEPGAMEVAVREGMFVVSIVMYELVAFS